jgi:hypothetical protein
MAPMQAYLERQISGAIYLQGASGDIFALGGYEPATNHLDPAAEGIDVHQIAQRMSRFR